MGVIDGKVAHTNVGLSCSCVEMSNPCSANISPLYMLTFSSFPFGLLFPVIGFFDNCRMKMGHTFETLTASLRRCVKINQVGKSD